MNRLLAKIPALLLTLTVGLIASSSAFATATIVIQNNDAAGVGFNDPTAAAPVGGNSGTTVGEQRLIAFQAAANIWGATLTSGPTIVINASWSPFTSSCTPTSGTLGSSGATGLRGNFANAPFMNFWYSIAQANALAGSDLNAGTAEISAQFNSNVGTSGCLTNGHWYYGLDNVHSQGSIDLVTVVLHEFAHGLGFASFTDESTGAQAGTAPGFPSIFDKFLLDNTTGKTWPDMNNTERVASAINNGNLVWNGAQVTSDSSVLSSGKDAQGHPQMFAPATVKPGSSVSHWDTAATPNQLMEPTITSTLDHGVTVASSPADLTFSLLRDIGWCAGCPQPPAPSPTPTPSPPPNDNFANAQLILGCSSSVTGTNVGATQESGEPNHAPDGNGGTHSVWYQWQSPGSGTVTFTTAGSNFDTVLAIYTNTLTLIGNNDDVNSGVVTTSTVTFTASAGTVYRIAVDGYNNPGSGGGETGNITLNWTASGCTVTAPTLQFDGTNRAIALDSVTFVVAPFSKSGLHNFSGDQLTRVMLFTTNLGLSQGYNPALTVQMGGVSVPIENVGTVPLQSQFSYIVVRLDPSVPTGTLNVNVTLHGATSNTATVDVIP